MSLISVILDKSKVSLLSESEPSDSSSSASVSIFKQNNKQCHKSKGDKVENFYNGERQMEV